jgi:peptidyl-dipeptidase A
MRMHHSHLRGGLAAAIALALPLGGDALAAPEAAAASAGSTAVAASAAAAAPAGGTATPIETADQFVQRLNRELLALSIEGSRANWVAETYITDDTQALAAKATDRYLEYFTAAVEQSKRYQGQPMSPQTARAIELLKQQVAAPAPKDPAKREEMTTILARLSATYGAGKYCPPVGENQLADPEKCRNIDQLSETLAQSRNYDELTEAWRQWHTISKPMRRDYARFVELANEGARELGYADLGAMWRSGYDMPADEFTKEAARLYSQVEPLYRELHCYARQKLAQKYGADKVPAGKPIPAQLFGNMWAQQWNKIYDVLEPYPGASDLDVDAALRKQGYDAVRMTKNAEAFYTSLGFRKLPQTFWERSMLVRPRDRDVVCHASAWSMDAAQDVRIKMCIQPTYEDLQTIYHELGHVFYYQSYEQQPYLFQGGANDGFHEAIGDTVTLSMTPAYLEKIGLVSAGKSSKEATINKQMQLASEKIAFLPFGKLIDEWRWRVFSGEIGPADYNRKWWELRRKYQGVSAPLARTEQDFDPGAKYHVPGNTPYTRYFLAFILQFQFQKALCDAAGWKGPLHECSVFGNEDAGRRFQAMLAEGASQPWQDTLEKLTGTRRMDASAILEYFAPLRGWLKQQNRGQQCGWES